MYPTIARRRGGFAEHVIQRGIGRAACFLLAQDCIFYLALLAKLAPVNECRVHAYALMGNHVHLLLSASRENGAARLTYALREQFGLGVQGGEGAAGEAGVRAGVSLEQDYAAWPIHSARHFLACMRYIELNPVRAGVVRRPEAFRWSSYRTNAHGRADALVSPHPHYLALGRDPERRRAAYRHSVEALL